MNIIHINKADVANGIGVRVSVFVSGCEHHCRGCFNSQAWNFENGFAYSEEKRNMILTYMSRLWVDGITIMGGEPLEPRNQKDVLDLITAVKATHPNKSVWLYTGFVLEDLINGKSRAQTEYLDDILNKVDVLVDGPFVESLRDPSLRFRGSSNQRIIDLPKTLAISAIVEKV